MKEEITFENAMDVVDYDKLLLKRRENNLLLSDYQVEVLNKYGINYFKYHDYKHLLFEIENILNDNYNVELDDVSSQIAEIIYYGYTNK